MNETRFLRPPGEGLHTVHTKSEVKRDVQYELYQTSDSQIVKKKWSESLELLGKKLTLLGFPSDSGGGIHRGANWGPLLLRQALLPFKNRTIDAGDILVIPQLLDDRLLNEDSLRSIRKEIYGAIEAALPVSPLSMLEYFCKEYFDKYSAPLLVLGGDHSLSAPILRQVLKKGPKTAIIHFDAHTDLMESRLGIKWCFATWAQEISKMINSADQFIQLGLRSSGKDKAHWENAFPVHQYWVNELVPLSPTALAKQLAEKWKKLNIENIYISFDVDVLDQSIMPLTGTAEEKGLSPEWICEFLKFFQDSSFNFMGADIVEFAPFVNMTDYPISIDKALDHLTPIMTDLVNLLTKNESKLCPV